MDAQWRTSTHVQVGSVVVVLRVTLLLQSLGFHHLVVHAPQRLHVLTSAFDQ